MSFILFGLISGVWSSHYFTGSSLARGMWMVSHLTAVLSPGCALTQTLQMSTHWGEWQNMDILWSRQMEQCLGNLFENSHYSCSFVTPVGQTWNISPLTDRCTLLIVHSYFDFVFWQISGAGPQHRGLFLYGLIQRTGMGWGSREKPPS